MLYSILIGVQVVISIVIIVLVLIQHGKGADAGAAFGSGASGTVFGARGSATFLSRTTAVLATAFFLNSLAMAWLAAHPGQGSSILNQPGVQQILNSRSKPSVKPSVIGAGAVPKTSTLGDGKAKP